MDFRTLRFKGAGCSLGSGGASHVDYSHCRYVLLHDAKPDNNGQHPDVMQSLSGGRYRLMFARAVPEYLKPWGSPPITFQRLADVISICRRLWAGETVSYDGTLGRFAALKLNDRHGGVPAPIFITAIGPKALEFGGTYCDGVVLHPFVTPYGVENSVKIVREAERELVGIPRPCESVVR